MSLQSIDVCISFDTTGSMYPCMTQVRRSVKDTVGRLFKDIPDLRMSIIAHGDYCDAGSSYVTKICDFTSDVNKIANFVNNVEGTGGGDAPECYELVLNEARTKLSWQSGRAKVLIMIGDDVPHGPTYLGNTKKIDWRNELGLLLEANINVYGVHAMPGIRRHSKSFYEEIARKTGGFYLTLEQFSTITDLIMAVCYKQEGMDQLELFAKEMQHAGRMNRSMQDSIRRMSGLIPEVRTVSGDLAPVLAGRFQVLAVHEEQSIREFVQDQGVTFKKGRGFYELTKSEKVQQYKEVILMDKSSGDIFNGDKAREMLGLLSQVDSGGETERLRPSHLNTYKVFIQSTSVNRKLIAGTSLLYEVEDWERGVAV